MKRAIILLSVVGLFAYSNANAGTRTDERNEEYVPIQLTKAQQELTAGVNDLAFDMLNKVVRAEELEDTFLSPLSLSAALSMVVNGADGATYEQIASVLGFEGKSVEEINAYYKLIIEKLTTADSKVDFVSANSVWVKPGFKLLDSYVATVEDNYLAAVEDVDMGTRQGIARINQWCSQNTNGKIPKFFDQPEPSIVLFLANALYFKGSWEKEFTKAVTDFFNHADGSVSQMKMMRAFRGIPYYGNKQLKCVELLYGNGAYAMDLILPEEGVSLEDAAAYLAQDGAWDEVASNLCTRKVILRFPKFKIENDMPLNDMLKELGMVDAFTPKADFSKMTERALMISSVKQKTYVDVTEKGTEAAAITGITAVAESARPYEEPCKFIADRPFFFLIRERSTGVVLFVGLKA